jgi:hypothetical protein
MKEQLLNYLRWTIKSNDEIMDFLQHWGLASDNDVSVDDLSEADCKAAMDDMASLKNKLISWKEFKK